jgi:hypothetical protein
MLRANLSSRPFYNERLVSAAIAGIAIAAIALAAFSVYQLTGLARQRSELKGRIARDAAQASHVETTARSLQRTIDRQRLLQLAGSTQEANALIDERTFSWTIFFGLIEKTLPVDLRLLAVTPRAERGRIRVTMTVVGKQLEAINTFVDALQETRSFSDLLPRNTERNEDDNTFRADVVAYYAPPGEPATAAPVPAPAAGKGQS